MKDKTGDYQLDYLSFELQTIIEQFLHPPIKSLYETRNHILMKVLREKCDLIHWFRVIRVYVNTFVLPIVIQNPIVNI